MDDFEIPSFSLGLDEPYDPCPAAPLEQAIFDDAESLSKCLHAENDHPVFYVAESPCKCLHAENDDSVVNPNAARVNFDSDFESPPRSSTRILKRLKRGPSKISSTSIPKQEECIARNATGSNDALQNCWRSVTGNKTFTSSKQGPTEDSGASVLKKEGYPARNTNESKANALQSFWKSLNDQKKLPVKPLVGADEDDIEECSSGEDFQHQECSQSARKPSLCGTAVVSGSFSRQNHAVTGMFQKDRVTIHEHSRSSDKQFGIKEKIETNVSKSRSRPDMSCKNKDDILVHSIGCDDDRRSIELGSGGYKTEQFPSMPSSRINQFEDNTTAYSAYRMFVANDPRINHLFQQRFPHFTPVSALPLGDQMSSERVYIDYMNQFAGGENAATPLKAMNAKKQAWQKAAKRAKAAPKRRKNAIADNDGWIQPGTPLTAPRSAGDAGTGHWVTEKSGKRIYITKDGRKLSGSSAYKQHMKESGKRFKKTKRRRPRSKK